MHYHEPKDLADFPNIGECNKDWGENHPGHYREDTGSGKRTGRDQSSLAMTLAMSPNNPCAWIPVSPKPHSRAQPEGYKDP